MSLFSLFELGPPEVEKLLAGGAEAGAAAGKVVAILDFLPLGPERLALAAAAARLGAALVEGRELFPGFPRDVDLLDAVRTVGAYADAIVLRHPLLGAARAAAEVSPAPVLLAGDGPGEDPLFGLADLAALSDRLGGLPQKSVALCGDLRRNRRVHSLAGGLLAAGARVLLVPAHGAEPEDGFLDGLGGRRGYHPVRFEAKSMSSLLDMVDSWLLTPELDHQLSLFSDVVTTDERERRLVRHQVKEIHAIWVAAPRDATGEPAEDPSRREGLPWRPRDGRAYVSPARPGEREADPAERSPGEVRALAAAIARALADGRTPALPEDAYVAAEGVRCRDARCVACREPVRVAPAFVMTRTDPVLLACVYCGSRRKAEFVGSREKRRYHPFTSGEARKILPQNAVFFGTREEAEAAGFVPAR